MNQPFVSVVTPFHNTAKYLAECIESVLAQSYPQFEYILVDNCSTDGSSEIAESFARRDPRIRLIKRAYLLSQVQNYNLALQEISKDSQYCKIVQADDLIFPDCLKLMVKAFEQSEMIGLVSAYDLKGNLVRGSGFPYRTSPVSGREVVRLYLRQSIYVFGSPSTVMYRSSLIREQNPFFDESLLHEDTEKCVQILENWDFGFVPQVLSFLRLDSDSISAMSRTFQPIELDRYIAMRRYASKFFEEPEASRLKRKSRRSYYSALAYEAFHFREGAFWQYHQKGLETVGEKIDWSYVVLLMLSKIAWLIVNPGLAVRRLLRFGYRKINGA